MGGKERKGEGEEKEERREETEGEREEGREGEGCVMAFGGWTPLLRFHTIAALLNEVNTFCQIQLVWQIFPLLWMSKS